MLISQFIQRFAGNEDVLCSAVRKQWAKVLVLLKAKSPAGSNRYTLPITVCSKALLDAHGEDVLV